MSQANITITLSCTVPANEAPTLLQKLLAALPEGVTPTATASPVTGGTGDPIGGGGLPPPHTWPPVPEDAGEEYKRTAEENLRQLQHGAIPDHGWGRVRDLQKVIGSLRSETRKVVLRAIQNGGHVTRDEVYALLERDETQSLKGFTKPAASLVERLMESGELPRNARPLLTPIYKQSKTYQQAQGFVVPLQVVSLMTRQS